MSNDVCINTVSRSILIYFKMRPHIVIFTIIWKFCWYFITDPSNMWKRHICRWHQRRIGKEDVLDWLPFLVCRKVSLRAKDTMLSYVAFNHLRMYLKFRGNECFWQIKVKKEFHNKRGHENRIIWSLPWQCHIRYRYGF